MRDWFDRIPCLSIEFFSKIFIRVNYMCLQMFSHSIALMSCTVFIRIVAGAIIHSKAYFPQNILSIFEKIHISGNLIILADQ